MIEVCRKHTRQQVALLLRRQRKTTEARDKDGNWLKPCRFFQTSHHEKRKRRRNFWSSPETHAWTTVSLAADPTENSAGAEQQRQKVESQDFSSLSRDKPNAYKMREFNDNHHQSKVFAEETPTAKEVSILN